MDKVIKELRKQERSLRWLSRKVGLHYMTVQYWVKNGVPRWHRVKVARALKRKVGDLFKTNIKKNIVLILCDEISNIIYIKILYQIYLKLHHKISIKIFYYIM